MGMLDQQVSNVQQSLFHASVMRQMRSLDPKANIDALLRSELGSVFASIYRPPTANRLGFYFGGSPVRRVLYVDGVTSVEQASMLIDGYGNRLGVPTVVGTNIWVYDNANYISQQIAASHTLDSEWLDCVGYSAGGAVATAFRSFLADTNSVSKSKLITFGAPRAGQNQMRDSLSRAAIARWMVNNDPIPLIPLRIQDAPQIALFYTVGRLLNWSNFVHTQGGITIFPDGTTQESGVPVDAAANPISSVVTWMWSEENDPNQPHAMTTYVAYLQRALQLTQTPEMQNPEVGKSEPDAKQETREVNRARQRNESAVATAGHQQNAVVPQYVETALFKAQRIGRTWYVALGDQIVITAPIRKRAEHIARAGNDFLKSLVKQAVVDVDGLQSQIDLFLQLASAPGSGFVPQINTSIPTE